MPAVTEQAANPVRTLEVRAEAWTQTRDHSAQNNREPLTHGWRRCGTAAGRTAPGDTWSVIADDDPTSCRVVTENVAECEHPASTPLRGTARAVVRPRPIHLEISQRVFRDGEPFFERTWRESVARDLY